MSALSVRRRAGRRRPGSRDRRRRKQRAAPPRPPRGPPALLPRAALLDLDLVVRLRLSASSSSGVVFVVSSPSGTSSWSSSTSDVVATGSVSSGDSGRGLVSSQAPSIASVIRCSRHSFRTPRSRIESLNLPSADLGHLGVPLQCPRRSHASTPSRSGRRAPCCRRPHHHRLLDARALACNPRPGARATRGAS